MRFELRHTLYAGLPALVLAACGDAGEDDAQRAAREAADAAQSAGEAVEEGWRSGDDERARLAEETGEAVVAVKAQVRAEWAEHRADRQAALEAAGDHVAAAGAAVVHGLDAAVEAYADTVDDDVNGDGFEARPPDTFVFQDERVSEVPLNGSVDLAAETQLEGARALEVDADMEIDRNDGDRAYVPSHTLKIDPHPCADYNSDAEDESDARHARCTPERG